MQLSAFQDGFAQALWQHQPDGAAPAWLAALQAQPGFAVYRNTVHKGCIDALQANYPTVCSLVGDEWFRAAAAVFTQQHPPTDGRLVAYGAAFAKWLAQFEPAASLPYLPAVATLDRLWTECHLAADAPPLPAQWLAQQTPDALATLVALPHPAARWHWCADHPHYTLWQRHREGLPMDDDLPWQGEGALLTRPQGVVQWQALSAAGVALLSACASGQTLLAATEHALQTDPHCDIPALVAQLLCAGALCAPI